MIPRMDPLVLFVETVCILLIQFVGDLIHSTWRVPDSFIRVVKSNWTADKSLLLKYILNDTASM